MDNPTFCAQFGPQLPDYGIPQNINEGYWALTQNDCENCGVAVHIVDALIDTGLLVERQGICNSGLRSTKVHRNATRSQVERMFET